jgi:predicted nucleotidyltransferase
MWIKVRNSRNQLKQAWSQLEILQCQEQILKFIYKKTKVWLMFLEMLKMELMFMI